MYFVVPVEKIEIDNGSNAVIETTLDKGRIYGNKMQTSSLWWRRS